MFKRSLVLAFTILLTTTSALAENDKTKLYVDSFGASDNASQFRYELQSELAKAGFIVVNEKTEAYGVLTGFANMRLIGQTPIFTGTNYTTDRYRADAQVVLSSLEGKELWRKSFSNSLACGVMKRHKNPLGCVAELASKALKENLIGK